ncbi:HAD family hydrolase [Anaerococcus marasmi]|uniref:HAD family hydrolase n=1 Tax=Anaerococcus marasmi TaxID=2057797 RepID=UPI000CF8E7DA|nr:HAD-IA family hydrolase [Anaerococcus marasmi]
MKYKLIIFDMDGLMFDTEIMYYNSWFEVSHKYDFNFNEDLRKRLTGKNEESVRDELFKILNSKEKVLNLREDLESLRENYFKTYTNSLKKEGLEDLLYYARENNIKCALASSSDREKIDFLLEKEKIRDFFNYIISGEDVEKSKPDPEIFIKAKENFDLLDKEALILEDSYNGYLACKKSNMDYLIIHDSSFDKYFEADREAKNLREVIDYLK